MNLWVCSVNMSWRDVMHCSSSIVWGVHDDGSRGHSRGRGQRVHWWWAALAAQVPDVPTTVQTTGITQPFTSLWTLNDRRMHPVTWFLSSLSKLTPAVSPPCCQSSTERKSFIMLLRYCRCSSSISTLGTSGVPKGGSVTEKILSVICSNINHTVFCHKANI